MTPENESENQKPEAEEAELELELSLESEVELETQLDSPLEAQTQHEPDTVPFNARFNTGERLQKLLSQAGIASRRAGEDLIAQGRVSINGHVVREPGARADLSRDHVLFDGKPLTLPSSPPTVVMLHKPKGCMTTLHDPEGRATVMELIHSDIKRKHPRLHPIGRLDFDTSGVLLLTDDGDLTQLLTHPSHGVEKVYQARVSGPFPLDVVRRLERGVQLEDGETSPCRVRVRAETAQNALVEITLREGRNRQVRRMLDAVGHPVKSLRRVKFGGFELHGLPPGESRELLPGEISALRKRAESPEKPRPARDKAPSASRSSKIDSTNARRSETRNGQPRPSEARNAQARSNQERPSGKRVADARSSNPRRAQVDDSRRETQRRDNPRDHARERDNTRFNATHERDAPGVAAPGVAPRRTDARDVNPARNTNPAPDASSRSTSSRNASPRDANSGNASSGNASARNANPARSAGARSGNTAREESATQNANPTRKDGEARNTNKARKPATPGDNRPARAANATGNGQTRRPVTVRTTGERSRADSRAERVPRAVSASGAPERNPRPSTERNPRANTDAAQTKARTPKSAPGAAAPRAKSEARSEREASSRTPKNASELARRIGRAWKE